MSLIKLVYKRRKNAKKFPVEVGHLIYQFLKQNEAEKGKYVISNYASVLYTGYLIEFEIKNNRIPIYFVEFLSLNVHRVSVSTKKMKRTKNHFGMIYTTEYSIAKEAFTNLKNYALNKSLDIESSKNVNQNYENLDLSESESSSNDIINGNESESLDCELLNDKLNKNKSDCYFSSSESDDKLNESKFSLDNDLNEDKSFNLSGSKLLNEKTSENNKNSDLLSSSESDSEFSSSEDKTFESSSISNNFNYKSSNRPYESPYMNREKVKAFLIEVFGDDGSSNNIEPTTNKKSVAKNKSNKKKKKIDFKNTSSAIQWLYEIIKTDKYDEFLRSKQFIDDIYNKYKKWCQNRGKEIKKKPSWIMNINSLGKILKNKKTKIKKEDINGNTNWVNTRSINAIISSVECKELMLKQLTNIYF